MCLQQDCSLVDRLRAPASSITKGVLSLSLSLAVVACSAAQPKAPPSRSEAAPRSQPKAAPSTETSVVTVAAATPVVPSNAPPPRPELFEGGVFPPQDPGAPFERSKKEGDGEWTNFFFDLASDTKHARSTENTRVDFGADVVRRIVIHPHEASRFQTLTVAAFDLRALRVGHRPGLSDVEDVGHPELSDRAGLVPPAEKNALFAVFNEGFQPRHGRFGMFSLDTQLVEPREDACTVAVLKDGTLRIGPWPELAKIKDEIVAYRQTPPCLVDASKVHPKLANLEKPERSAWAGQQKDLKTQRRSVVGLSEDGRTLFFGVGGETEVEVLAAGMVHLGARVAAQLDINWNWTRLFVFEPTPSGPVLQGALILDMARDRGEYIARPGKRSFFYLTRRTSADSLSSEAALEAASPH